MAGGVTYDRAFLDSLREGVISTLRDRMQQSASKLDNQYEVKTPNSDRSKSYEIFQIDIQTLTNKEISVGTLFKFLYRSDKPLTLEKDKIARTFHPDKIAQFEEYIEKGKINETTKSQIAKKLPFKGGYLIDEDFKNAKEIASKTLNSVKFYTTKLDPESQWLGVIKGLDYERSLLKQIEKEVLFCFERQSKVCTVIHGPHGAGKSTFLRKLAINCIKYSNEIFTTLWLDDIHVFHTQWLPSIIDNGEKYLIIIEDWPLIVRGYTRLSSFFNSIANSNNIRIIIGDVSPSMQYMDYVYGKNVYELEAFENENIVLHVLKKVPEWRDTAKTALQNKDIYKAPLFCILFVIAKSSEEQGNILNIDTDDFVSQFTSIIARDQQKIHALHPGLARVLYYWANTDKFYAIKTVFTWEDLLKWADSYSELQNRTADLNRYNEQNPICKILSQYFGFHEILNPLSLHKYQIFYLNDAFLDIFCLTPLESWYFDRSVSLDIIDKLATAGIKDAAEAFFNAYLTKIMREKIVWPNTEPWDPPRFKIDVAKIENEKPHKMLREKIDLLEYPSYFKISSASLRNFIDNIYPYNGNVFAEIAELWHKEGGYKEANTICNFLIEKGCKMREIKDLQEASMSRETLETYFLNHCGWYWGEDWDED